MSWKKNFFDEEHPSITKQIVVSYIMVVAVGALFAIWVDFVPSGFTSKAGNIAAMVLTGAISAWAFQNFKKGKNPKFKRMSKKGKMLGVISLPFFIYSLSWLFFVHSFPAFYTAVLGQGYEVSAVFQKKHSSSRRACDYRIKSELLENAFPSYMCINKVAYESYGNEYTLIGKSSLAGTLFSSIDEPTR